MAMVLSIVANGLLAAEAPQVRQLGDRIDSALSKMSDSGYGYSVLVSVDGKVVLQHAYGWTDAARKCPTTERTLFNIASITKSFTAIAVLQLRHQGKLKLEDPLPVFFKNVPKGKQEITIEQLLTHTSGLAQHYAADGMRERNEAVQAILSDTLAFDPGTAFSYSNENYELLAAVIEVLTGKSYESYIRENILAKANMAETRFWDEVGPESGCAVASTTRTLDATTRAHNWGYVGSGGVYSTAGDLHRWFLALAAGRLLDPESLDLMWKPHWTLTEANIAYGWFVSTTSGVRELWTRGSEDWGHNGVLRWFPERKVLVIVQSNSGERDDKNMTANRLISDEIVKRVL